MGDRRPIPSSFIELGLPEPVVAAMRRRGITQPTAIQTQSIPDALAGRDILGRAETGSGKTLAFGLPMLTRLHLSGSVGAPCAPRGLVLVPTRELARQVTEELGPIAHALDLQVTAVFGGASLAQQVQRLRRGAAVVVATPGRLLDLTARDALRLNDVEIAVLDEADHMADLGFLPAVTRILDAIPAQRQCLLFSATLDRGIDRLVIRYLSDPVRHATTPATAAVANMDHRVFLLRREDKITIAAEIAARPARTLFFVRTKRGADRLAGQLAKRSINAAAIHGNLTQNQRNRTLDSFSAGRTRVLVATNVAARGLHVDDLDLVVHYDPPADHKDYLHRSGRTARAGAAGTVITLVEPDQTRAVAHLHRAASVQPDTTSICPGHAAVSAIATSGTPLPEPPPAPSPPTASRRGRTRPRKHAFDRRQRRSC